MMPVDFVGGEGGADKTFQTRPVAADAAVVVSPPYYEDRTKPGSIGRSDDISPFLYLAYKTTAAIKDVLPYGLRS